ncbi:MAG: lipopolysaccharide biosynthesis protein [Bdellovibrionota bacterium]
MRFQRSFYSLFSRTAQTMLALAVGFLITPFVFRFLGQERFGAYKALTTYLDYFYLLEFGAYGSLLALFSKSIATRNRENQRRELILGLRWYTRIAAICILAGLGFSFFSHYFIPVSLELRQDLRATCIISLIGFIFITAQPFRAFLEAEQKSYHIHLYLAAQAILVSLSSYLFSKNGWGIRGQAVAMVFGGTLFYLAICAILLPQFPGLIRSTIFERIPRSFHIKLWNLQWPTFLNDLSGRICLLTDNIVVSILLGPKWIAPFFLTQPLMSVAESQLQGVGASTWAALGELYATDQHETFRSRLVEVTRMTLLFSISVIIPICTFNSSFIRLWVGADQYLGDFFTLIVGFNALLLPILSIWGWAFVAAGKSAILVPVFLSQAVMNLTLSIYFTTRIGISGPVLGTLLTYIAIPLFAIPYLMKKHFKVSPVSILRPLAETLNAGACVSAVLYESDFNRIASHWMELLLKMGLLGGIIFILGFFTLIRTHERSLLAERFKSLAKKGGEYLGKK